MIVNKESPFDPHQDDDNVLLAHSSNSASAGGSQDKGVDKSVAASFAVDAEVGEPMLDNVATSLNFAYM